MRRYILAVWISFILCLIPNIALAQRMNIDDVLELVKAGSGDNVIIAQIKATRSVFHLSTRDILELKAAGVSDQLLVTMIESRRQLATSPIPQPTFRSYPTPFRSVVQVIVPSPNMSTAHVCSYRYRVARRKLRIQIVGLELNCQVNTNRIYNPQGGGKCQPTNTIVSNATRPFPLQRPFLSTSPRGFVVRTVRAPK